MVDLTTFYINECDIWYDQFMWNSVFRFHSV